MGKFLGILFIHCGASIGAYLLVAAIAGARMFTGLPHYSFDGRHPWIALLIGAANVAMFGVYFLCDVIELPERKLTPARVVRVAARDEEE